MNTKNKSTPALFLTDGDEKSDSELKPSCLFHPDTKKKHKLFDCKQFLALEEKDRFDQVRQFRRCWNCGDPHLSMKCPESRSCSDSDCQIRVKHSAILQGGFRKNWRKEDGNWMKRTSGRLIIGNSKKASANEAEDGVDEDALDSNKANVALSSVKNLLECHPNHREKQ